MSFRNPARLFDCASLAAGLRQYTQSIQAAALPVQIDIAEQLKWRWSLDAWLQGWQESTWLAVPKKKVCWHCKHTCCRAWTDTTTIYKIVALQVSPHRRGMRNAGKHQKMVPVMSRCKCVSLLLLLHQACISTWKHMHVVQGVQQSLSNTSAG